MSERKKSLRDFTMRPVVTLKQLLRLKLFTQVLVFNPFSSAESPCTSEQQYTSVA
jgi:hypothetical protein